MEALVRWRHPHRGLLTPDLFILLAIAGTLLALISVRGVGAATSPQHSLQFDGMSSYVEVPDSPGSIVSTTGSLTISGWMRPDTLTFPATEGPGYVYWLRKGEPGWCEWAFRMYSQDNLENGVNRISFYIFNPDGGLGIGSCFQDPVTPGEWIHVVAVVDGDTTSIYENGALRKCDQYRGSAGGPCPRHAADGTITPQHGTAPLRIALGGYFQGALAEVRIWNRALSATEIATLCASDTVPQKGLVAEYLLDENGDGIAHDTAGGHDGIINGGES